MLVVIATITVCVVMLYAWCIGHPFGRFLAFIAFAFILGVIGSHVIGAPPIDYDRNWLGILCGIALAWPLSGIPTYVRNRRTRNAPLEMHLR